MFFSVCRGLLKRGVHTPRAGHAGECPQPSSQCQVACHSTTALLYGTYIPTCEQRTTSQNSNVDSLAASPPLTTQHLTTLVVLLGF